MLGSLIPFGKNSNAASAHRSGLNTQPHSVRNASTGFRFAAWLAGLYPKSRPTPLDAATAATTPVQEILNGTIFSTSPAADHTAAIAVITPIAVPAKLIINASNKN